MREIVIVQSEVQTVDTPEFRAKVEALQHEIASLGPKVAIPERNYYTTNPLDENLVSADRMTTFMTVVMAGYYVEAVKNVEHVLEVVEEANGVDGFRALTIGDASIAFEQNELSEKDLRQGERIRHSRCAGDSGGTLWHFGGGADADRTVYYKQS